MDIRSRTADPSEMQRVAHDALQLRIWTALPGIIESFDPVTMTCEVQPTIMARITQPNTKKRPPTYTTTLESFPLLRDCPVVFPAGGGYALTFPLTKGDECLVVFGARGIDWWWQSGGVQPPAEARMHSLSDGFVIPGPFSQPRRLANISVDAVQLRSTDGEVTLSLSKGGVSITGPTASLYVEQNLTAGTGASGSFTTPTGQTVTVQGGIITNLS